METTNDCPTVIDAYRIGVSIALSSNGDQVLGSLMRHLLGIHGAADIAEKKMKGLKIAALGAVGAVAGFSALKGIWDVIKASKELNEELERTKQLGGEFAGTVANARLAAFRTADQVRTNTPAENVRVQRELGTQLQNPQAAIDILPLAQKVAYVVSHYTGENQEDIVKNLVKTADIRAQIFTKGADGKEHVDPAKVMSEFEAAAKGLIVAGNYLKSNDLVQMARQAGVPAKSMTQEAFYANLVEMAVSQGASRTGTAVTSLFSQLVGGTMPVHTAVEMTRMGLMTKAQWHSDHGHIVIDKEATDKFSGALKDPIKWITDVLDPLLTKQGMDTQQKLAEVFKLFGRQTTQRLVAEALSSEPQFARVRSMVGNVPNVGAQYAMLQNEDLETNIKSLDVAWTGFMQALGEQGVPMAISILHGVTDGIHEFTGVLVATPAAGRLFLELSAGVAGLLTVSGGLTASSIALRGLTGELGALGPAASSFAAGGSGALGIGGLIGLLGRLSLVVAAFAAGGAIGDFLSKTFDHSGADAHPVLDPIIKWANRVTGADGSGGLPQVATKFLPKPQMFVPFAQPAQHMPAIPTQQSFAPPPPPLPANSNQPVPVIVTNPADIAKGTIAHIAKQASRPQAGSTGPDYRIDPGTVNYGGGF